MGVHHGLEVSALSFDSAANVDLPSYALQWLIVLPLEIIAASITVGYWNSDLHRSIFITIFLFAIFVINLFGVKGYGEAEFVFAIIKITAVIGFM
jgi:amino acid transporter